MESAQGFEASDAWVLAAVALASGKAGALLADVVASGDYINHAIFEPSELSSGLTRLAHAGLVREQSGRFFLDGPALQHRATSRGKRVSLQPALARYRTLLATSQAHSSGNLSVCVHESDASVAIATYVKVAAEALTSCTAVAPN